MRNASTISQISCLMFMMSLLVLSLFSGSSAGQNIGKGSADKTSRSGTGHPVIRLNVKFPPEKLAMLDLSGDQIRRINQVPNTYEEDLIRDMTRIGESYYNLENAVLADQVDEGLVQQRVEELRETYTTQIKTKANMLRDVRNVLDAQQVARLREQLPLEKIGLQVSARVPDSLVLIEFNSEQSTAVEDIISRYGKMLVPSAEQKLAAQLALERAIMADQYDQSLVEARCREFAEAFDGEIKTNAAMFRAIRDALTPAQVASLRGFEQRLAAGELLAIGGQNRSVKLGSPVYTVNDGAGDRVKIKNKFKN